MGEWAVFFDKLFTDYASKTVAGNTFSLFTN